jgi:hypothetical protein
METGICVLPKDQPVRYFASAFSRDSANINLLDVSRNLDNVYLVRQRAVQPRTTHMTEDLAVIPRIFGQVLPRPGFRESQGQKQLPESRMERILQM